MTPKWPSYNLLQYVKYPIISAATCWQMAGRLIYINLDTGHKSRSLTTHHHVENGCQGNLPLQKRRITLKVYFKKNGNCPWLKAFNKFLLRHHVCSYLCAQFGWDRCESWRRLPLHRPVSIAPLPPSVRLFSSASTQEGVPRSYARRCFFFLATFISLSPHVSPICLVFSSVFLLYVYVMSLAQCSPLVVAIFMVHFGAALLSFLVFLIAPIICNTMGMFHFILLSHTLTAKNVKLYIWPLLFETYCDHLRAGGELDWIKHRRHGEQWKVKCLGGSSIFNKRETDKTEEESE